MSSGERVGILGGTFNPIHLGHLRAAEEVREQLDLSRMLLVPSAEPPHKPGSSLDPIAPAAQRLEWLQWLQRFAWACSGLQRLKQLPAVAA